MTGIFTWVPRFDAYTVCTRLYKRSIHLTDGVRLNDMVKQMLTILENTGVVLYY